MVVVTHLMLVMAVLAAVAAAPLGRAVAEDRAAVPLSTLGAMVVQVTAVLEGRTLVAVGVALTKLPTPEVLAVLGS